MPHTKLELDNDQMVTMVEVHKGSADEIYLTVRAVSRNKPLIREAVKKLQAAIESIAHCERTMVAIDKLDELLGPETGGCSRCGCAPGSCKHDFCATCGGRPTATVN